MGGPLGDELNGVLQSPLTQTLAPAILGGVGGALSAPPMLGRRGAIGYGLQGGAQGLERGMELSGMQQNRQLEAQKFQEEIKNAQIDRKIKQYALNNQDARQAIIDKIQDPDEKARAIANFDQWSEGKLLDKEKPIYLKGMVAQGAPQQLVDALQGAPGDLVRDMAKNWDGRPDDLRTAMQAVQHDHPDWGPSQVFTGANDMLHREDQKRAEQEQKFQQQITLAQMRNNAMMERVMAEREGRQPKYQPYIDQATGQKWGFDPATNQYVPSTVAGNVPGPGNLARPGAKPPPPDEEAFNKAASPALKAHGIQTTGPNAMHPVKVDDKTGIVTYSTDPSAILGNVTTRTVHLDNADKHFPDVEHVNSKDTGNTVNDLVNDYGKK